MYFDARGRIIALTATALAISACVQPERVSAAEPTMHSEAMAHPRIVKAIHEMREALHYHLHMDDAAIERAEVE